MKSMLICFCLLLFYVPILSAQFRVILDADIDSDVDDVEALAMLHTLADEKKIDFAGVIVTSDDPYAPLCVDAINAYLGRPNLPVGFLKSQKELKNHSKYTRQISEEFSHRLRSLENAQEATALYRKILSRSPDSSVVIITIGHLTSFQQLLQSGADTYSPLDGKALASKKVARWICMGGMFPEGKEANFYRPDPLSTVYCLQAWDKQVIFCGWEVGKEVITGDHYLKKSLPVNNPVYRAYELYNGFAGRPSWDQIAVLLLTEKASTFFDSVTNGYCYVSKDGSNQWLSDKDSNHEYIKIKPEVNPNEIARFIDDLVLHNKHLSKQK
jgi:inosine-uridine nucleoside N-ribohydrolase